MAPVWSAVNRAVFAAKTAPGLLLSRAAAKNANQIRQMSGGGHDRFVVQPTRWQWHKFKDLLHFYTFVGAIPLGLISLYANLFIGPAELAPIPEGYKPQEYEYYRHPITRFFKKYIMEGEQEAYERHMHYIWEVYDKSQYAKIENEVKTLQANRGDYQHWYYIPTETQTYQVMQQDVYEMEQERSFGR
ncbi:NADH dehydrogenase [ubiquinone] 1 beta subcomplex subunit 5, mitochondrial [Thrips palmi]|uniref:NADH dehydrogenase [ubiquinone] 1 beta subcomplex subunit 5, mitochondrial n=1 Tax=Thrips palmi TaxID=161013 RepID=A0A6P8YPS6_THRPL|nr:NADH dehydrogenase [ubiquinone] 1 beta subcomplex subunit 5, mitochondrial [Thrips palmi]